MIRSLVYSIVLSLTSAACCQADFVVDDFSVLAASGGPTIGLSSSLSLTVTESATGTGITLFGTDDPNQLYVMGALTGSATDTASFNFLYTWGGGNWQDLAGVEFNSLRLDSLPLSSPNLSDWQVTADLGAAGTITQSADNFSSISLNNATQLSLTFDYAPAAGSGFSVLTFGGNNPLIATPEPTSFLLMGSLSGLALIRRRQSRRLV